MIGRLQGGIDEKVHMVLMIVDDPEYRNGPGRQSQVFFHPFRGGKGNFPLLEFLFQIPDIELPPVVQDHQVMPVTFVVPEKKILAMGCINIFPVREGLLYGRNRGVFIDFKGNLMLFQVVNDFFSSAHAATAGLSDHIGQLHTVLYSCLHKDTMNMILYCLHGDKQSFTDLLVGQPPAYLTHHFAFSFADVMLLHKGLQPGFEIIRQFAFPVLGFAKIDIHEQDGDQMPGEKDEEKDLEEKGKVV
jgi:hypothetical protein